jgi:hypothetical protein
MTSKVLTVIFPLPALFIGLLMGAFGHRHAWKVCRLALIVIAIEVVLGFAVGIATGPSEASAGSPLLGATDASGSPNYCVGDARQECLVRPQRLFTGAHTYVRGIRWRSWNGSTALGFGRLIEVGGCCNPSFNDRAKIRLSLPGECGNRIWYYRLSINFGPHFHRQYLHNAETVPC